MANVQQGLFATGIGISVNIMLAIIKITAGIFGNSYALIADGVESTTDIVSSLVTWTGLKISLRPADENHPYGHGKAESIAGLIVASALLAAAALIAFQSIEEIRTPHHAPKWFTLLVLALVVVVKESLFRFVGKVGEELTSTAVKGDAWHHRSDAITSLAAFIGISIALVGGVGYESADDWAALLSCLVIAYSGFALFKNALDELMDAAVPAAVQRDIRAIADAVPGVVRTEKCLVRKSGIGLHVDVHVEVDGDMSVRRGHAIAHEVSANLKASRQRVIGVMVHVEPYGEPHSPHPCAPPPPQ